MTSTIFTRRALLSGSALLGLGTLLAACGQQAANEAIPSASSTTATPSETASASESPSASATPSTIRGYSGQSKAPDGEYRKADKYGNAQNVLKPSLPEEGYNEKSLEGLRKTFDAWVQWGNYGIQTGDYAKAREFISPNFSSELEAYESVEKLYRRGGWVIDGIEKFTADGSAWSEDGETYFWKMYRNWNQEIHVEPDGKWTAWDNEDKTNDTLKVKMKHNGQKWSILDFEEFNV
jgi:N2,N2-dimethylguanosine tRNA methyltransferase